MAIIITILIFELIIIIHEYGHFVVARKCGVFVEEFSIGMGPKIYSKTKNETIYSIRVFPLGGYCKMKGEDSCEEDSKDSFYNKTILQKLAVIFAGPLMNFILAFVIFLFFALTSGFATTTVKEVLPNYPAQQAGILKGDKIYKINNKKIKINEDISYYINEFGKNEVEIFVYRNGQKLKFNVKPVLTQDKRYVIGLASDVKAPMLSKNTENISKAGFFESINNSFWNMIFNIKITIAGVLKLFTFQVSFDEVMGPIGLAPIISETYNVSLKTGVWTMILTMLNITAIFSANIGVMNLLPIPALDGGRILFLLIELVRGKAIPQEKEGVIHFIGFVILLAFGIFIAFKDLFKIF